MIVILMGFKVLYQFTVAFSKSLYFCSHKKGHSLLEISEKVQITATFQKTKFHKYATSGVNAFSIKSFYLIQFIMDQNCHSSC